MLIEEVLNVVHGFIRENAKQGEVNCTVYMTYEFYHDCMVEIAGRQGEVSLGVMEFYHDNVIHGFPVYKVVPTGDKSKPHPPWRVV